MAVRPFLCLGDNICKCIFTSVQLKPKLYTSPVYNQIRQFKKFRGNERRKITLRNETVKEGHVPLSKLWKPFTFTIMYHRFHHVSLVEQLLSLLLFGAMKVIGEERID